MTNDKWALDGRNQIVLNDQQPRKYFDILSGCFYVEYFHVSMIPKMQIFSEKKKFRSFKEFYDYLEGDIYTNSCFYGYSFTDEEISNFDIDINSLNFDSFIQETIDDYTFESVAKMRGVRRKTFGSYNIYKEFDDGMFIVSQEWTDKNRVKFLSHEIKLHYFFDFVHFLKGDLSGADLLFCDGLENIVDIKNLKIDGITIRSDVAEKLNLPLKIMKRDKLTKFKTFKAVEQNEKDSSQALQNLHLEFNDKTKNKQFSYINAQISYITDIHIEHRLRRFGCKTEEDISYVIGKIAENLSKTSTSINLIGGDTVGEILPIGYNLSSINMFEEFISYLSKDSSGDFFLTLGNHELWPFPDHDLSWIVKKYKEILRIYSGTRIRFHMVQNNIFYYLDNEWYEIDENDLTYISIGELKTITRDARLIIFGGIGFAGYNDELNAGDGVYGLTLDQKAELLLTKQFLKLYDKVISALKNRNLIVITHMPIKDWGGENIKKVIYVSGHNHKNFFEDDGETRIYSDNQIGYRGESVFFKQFSINFTKDWFADYEDGVFEITREDYITFYHGIQKPLDFNRPFKKLFMIKRDKYKMFFIQTSRDLYLLSGGDMRSMNNHSIKYFFNNLITYAENVQSFFSQYFILQNKLSSMIINIGGSGITHGCIIDIDFNNHLYLNPFDQTITPYFAKSMTQKIIFKNIPSLLKEKCPELYKNYLRINGNKTDMSYVAPSNQIIDHDTQIYKVSNVIHELQYLINFNVVRVWNDSFLKLTHNKIDEEMTPKLLIEDSSKLVRERTQSNQTKNDQQVVNSSRFEKYKTSVKEATGGQIEVVAYFGYDKKAEYRCTKCGHTWSIRPDHFKDQQKMQCPLCSKK